MTSKAFALIACRRTGSNYLMKILDSFPEMEFFGEVYHNQTVWMPIERKKEYVEWLKNTHNLEVKAGDKPFEDKELVRLNHDRPEYFLEFLNTTKHKYAGFKIFPEHLKWHKLKSKLLTNKEVPKIVLKRNLLDVYISDKILQLTKSSQAQDTSNIKIDFNCLDFKTWYYDTQCFYSRVEMLLKNSNQKYAELSYEYIHSHGDNEEKVAFIQSWLNQNGIQIQEQPKISGYTKKQDKRKRSLAKVKNVSEVEDYLERHNLQHLVHS